MPERGRERVGRGKGKVEKILPFERVKCPICPLLLGNDSEESQK